MFEFNLKTFGIIFEMKLASQNYFVVKYTYLRKSKTVFIFRPSDFLLVNPYLSSKLYVYLLRMLEGLQISYQMC